MVWSSKVAFVVCFSLAIRIADPCVAADGGIAVTRDSQNAASPGKLTARFHILMPNGTPASKPVVQHERWPHLTPATTTGDEGGWVELNDTFLNGLRVIASSADLRYQAMFVRTASETRFAVSQPFTSSSSLPFATKSWSRQTESRS